MRITKILVAAALFAATLQTAPSEAQTMDVKVTATNPVVTIGVTASEEATPDMASLSAGVEASSPDAKVALDEANKKMAKLMAAVKAAKFDPKDMQTSAVSVQEDFDYTDNGPVSKGFKASNSVTLTVRDLKKLEKLISNLVDAGATNVSGPYFSIENEDALTDKARMKAFDQARRRAMAYANKAGFKNVRLLQVRENVGDNFGGAAYAAADAASAAGEAAKAAISDTPIEPGTIARYITANFQFEMVP
jgi:uncharacterized protein